MVQSGKVVFLEPPRTNGSKIHWSLSNISHATVVKIIRKLCFTEPSTYDMQSTLSKFSGFIFKPNRLVKMTKLFSDLK